MVLRISSLEDVSKCGSREIMMFGARMNPRGLRERYSGVGLINKKDCVGMRLALKSLIWTLSISESFNDPFGDHNNSV